jgi:hypothetical protein
MWSFSKTTVAQPENTTPPPSRLREEMERALAERERATDRREEELKKYVVETVSNEMYEESQAGLRKYIVSYAYLKLYTMWEEGCIGDKPRNRLDDDGRCESLAKRFDACITSTINEEFVKKQGFEFKNGVIIW